MVSSSGETLGVKALGRSTSVIRDGPHTKRDIFDDADSSEDSRSDAAGLMGNVPGSPGRDPFTDTDSSDDGSLGVVDSIASPAFDHAPPSAVGTCGEGCSDDSFLHNRPMEEKVKWATITPLPFSPFPGFF